MSTIVDNSTGDAGPPPASPVAAPGAIPFRPPNLALATIGLALASFMQVLDTTIANVSLPTISGNLGASANQATWVITSFAVSNAIALPLTGYMTRRFGERKLFIWATLAFVIASFLCGIANSMGLLVVARALQGFVCWTDVSGHPGAADLDLPAAQTRAGDRTAGDGHRRRADRRTDPRRLDHRQLQLGMDLLHQHSHRHLRQHGGGRAAERPPGTPGNAEDGLRRPGHADRSASARCRSCSTWATTRTGSIRPGSWSWRSSRCWRWPFS